MVIGVIEIARDRRSIAEKALHSVLSAQWESLKLEVSEYFPTYLPVALSDDSENRKDGAVTIAF